MPNHRKRHPKPSLWALAKGRVVRGSLLFMGYAYRLHPTKGWRREKLHR